MGAILYKDKVYGVGGSIIEGYYKIADGKFYEESTYETEIPGAEDLLYIDLTSKMQFIFDGTNFVNITEDAKPTVTEASSRTNIASGDTLKTIIGKIKKFFADLKTVAFSGSYSDLTGKPTKLSDFTDDVVSGNYVKLSNAGVQTIRNTASSGDTAVRLRSNAADSWLAFNDGSNNFIGSFGVKSDKRPYYYDGTSSAGLYPFLLNGDTFVYKVVELPEANAPITAGWRRVCKIATKVGYANGFIMMNGGYENITPTTAVIAFSCMYNKSRFFLINSSNLGAIKKIRTVYVSNGTFWIDVYIENAATTGKQGKQRLIFFGNYEISDIQNSMAVYTDTVTANYELEIPSNSTIAGIPVVQKRAGIQYIENTAADTALRLKGNSASYTYLSFRDKNDAHLGSIGVHNDHLPYFGYNNESIKIALLKSSSVQTIENTGSDTALRLKSNTTSSWIAFYNSSGTFLGSFGVDADKKAKFYNGTAYFLVHSGNIGDYALTNTITTLASNKGSSAGDSFTVTAITNYPFIKFIMCKDMMPYYCLDEVTMPSNKISTLYGTNNKIFLRSKESTSMYATISFSSATAVKVTLYNATSDIKVFIYGIS